MGYCSTTPKSGKLLVIIAGDSKPTDFQGKTTGNFPGTLTPVYNGIIGTVKSYYNGSLGSNFEVGINSWYPNNDGTTYGLSASLAYRLGVVYGRTVVIGNIALGNTYLAQAGSMDWNVASAGKSFAAMKTMITGAMTAIADPTYKVVIVFDVGYWDATDGTGTYAAALQTNMTNFINQTRTDLGYSTLPFLIPQLNSHTIGAVAAPELATVRAGQAAAVAATTNSYLINTDTYGLATDNIHYLNHTTVVGIGNQLADKINSII